MSSSPVVPLLPPANARFTDDGAPSTMVPIPLAWRATTCAACGASVRRMRLGDISVTLDPSPVSVLAERFGRDGAITAYEHRVGYQPHSCTTTADANE